MKNNLEKSAQLYSIIAELVQELLDLGKEPDDIVWILKQQGMLREEIRDWYGI